MRFMPIAALLLLAAAPQQRGPRTGSFNEDIRDPVKKDVIMRVAMQVPTKLPPQRSLGLIFVFHGFGGSENNAYLPGTIEGLRRLKLLDQYVLISGKSKAEGWAEADDEPVRRMIAWARDTYPIDSRRVTLFGSSNGAGMVGRFGWQNQDLVAAVVGYCGGYSFGQGGAPDGDTKTEFYFVHGGNDNPDNSGHAAGELRARGYRAVFRKLDGYGHTDIWDGAGHPDTTVVNDCIDDWLAWIHLLRHKEMALSSSEQKFLASFETPSRAESLFQNKGTFVQLAQLGAVGSCRAVAQALQSKTATVRGNAASVCEKVPLGRASCVELGRIAREDDADRVRQVAIRALALYAHWGYPEAHAGLAATAENRTAKVGERPLAIESIAKALRMAFYGIQEEQRASFWSLVRLLDDEEAKVRGAAFQVLAKAVPDGHGYRPGAAADARKDAVDRWKAWATQKCGAESK